MFFLSPSRLFSLFLLLSFLGILTGCAGMGSHMERPRISIADIQVQEIKTLETVFILELRIMNPNDTALDVRGVSCNLQIDGRHLLIAL